MEFVSGKSCQFCSSQREENPTTRIQFRFFTDSGGRVYECSCRLLIVLYSSLPRMQSCCTRWGNAKTRAINSLPFQTNSCCTDERKHLDNCFIGIKCLDDATTFIFSFSSHLMPCAISLLSSSTSFPPTPDFAPSFRHRITLQITQDGTAPPLQIVAELVAIGQPFPLWGSIITALHLHQWTMVACLKKAPLLQGAWLSTRAVSWIMWRTSWKLQKHFS